MVAGLALVVGPVGVWAADTGTPVPAARALVAAAPVLAPPVPLPRIAEEPAAPAPPVRVRLPALGVDAPVTPVGVDDRGRMDVPFDIRTVGWYRFGPGPGATTGSAVLSGHVDDRDQGYGAFHRLGDLARQHRGAGGGAGPGAGGLTLLPYLDGERTPNRPAATGVLTGLTSAVPGPIWPEPRSKRCSVRWPMPLTRSVSHRPGC